MDKVAFEANVTQAIGEYQQVLDDRSNFPPEECRRRLFTSIIAAQLAVSPDYASLPYMPWPTYLTEHLQSPLLEDIPPEMWRFLGENADAHVAITKGHDLTSEEILDSLLARDGRTYVVPRPRDAS